VSDSKTNIWRIQAHLDNQGLIEALKNPDASIRKRAIVALRAMNASKSLPALREALQNENDADVREELTNTIASLAPDDETVTPDIRSSSIDPQVTKLIEDLKTNNPKQMIAAAKQLGDLGNKIAVEPLVLQFNNTRHSMQVRLVLAEALLKLESAPVEVSLLATLRHRDWHIRRNGAAILGQLKAEWAIIPLSKALYDTHPIVRRTSRAALKHIGTPDARKALARYAKAKEQAGSQKPPKNEAQTQPTLDRNKGLLQRVSEFRDSVNEQTQSPQTPDALPQVNPNIRPKAVSAQRQQPKSDTAKLKANKQTRPLNADVLDRFEKRKKNNKTSTESSTDSSSEDNS